MSCVLVCFELHHSSCGPSLSFSIPFPPHHVSQEETVPLVLSGCCMLLSNRQKNSWVQLHPPSLFLFFFPLPLPSDSPLPPLSLFACFFPSRGYHPTTCFGSSWLVDCLWWGGPGVRLVRALPVMSQLSAVREHSVCSGGTSRICLCLLYALLQHSFKPQRFKDIKGLSVFTQLQELPDKELKRNKHPLILSFSFCFSSASSFLFFVFDQQNPWQHRRSRSS